MTKFVYKTANPDGLPAELFNPGDNVVVRGCTFLFTEYGLSVYPLSCSEKERHFNICLLQMLSLLPIGCKVLLNVFENVTGIFSPIRNIVFATISAQHIPVKS